MVPEKVSEPVLVKFGIEQKVSELVSEKVSVSVSKILGTGKKYRYDANNDAANIFNIGRRD